jgi:hypothetical protein
VTLVFISFSPQQQQHDHAKQKPYARRRHEHSAAEVSAIRQPGEHHFDGFELVGDPVKVAADLISLLLGVFGKSSRSPRGWHAFNEMSLTAR